MTVVYQQFGIRKLELCGLWAGISKSVIVVLTCGQVLGELLTQYFFAKILVSFL